MAGAGMKNTAGWLEKTLRWTAVGLWFAFILSLSKESFASAHTEGWLAQLLASWGLNIGPFVGLLNLIVRKCAHFVEYAILGVLLYRAWERTWPAGSPLAAALILAALGAGCDEIGQAQIATRTGAVKDVLLDSVGGTFGAFAAARGWCSGWRRWALASRRVDSVPPP